jgi:hypothetical protein
MVMIIIMIMIMMIILYIYFYVFRCGLLNSVVSRSDYIAWYDNVVCEYWKGYGRT